MKKLLLLFALVTLSAGSAMAGNGLFGLFHVGGRIGIISSTQGIPTTTDGVKDAIKAEGTGWTGNVFARINIPKTALYLQPELQYTNTTINIPDVNDLLGKGEKKESHSYIDLPVLLGLEFGLGSLASVRINAGPVFPITTEKGFKELTKEDFEGAWNNFKANKQMTWTAGLGVKVLSLIAEIRYNGNFNGDTVSVDNISVNTERTSWNLSLGVMF